MSCRLVVLAEIVNAISCEDPSRKTPNVHCGGKATRVACCPSQNAKLRFLLSLREHHSIVLSLRLGPSQP